MKKLFSILMLTGLSFIGCSSERDNLLEDIFKNRTFEVEKYMAYHVSTIPDVEKSKVHSNFDLNKNGKTDLTATIKMEDVLIKGDTLFFRPNPYAFLIGINKNENEKYELFYMDIDGDHYFESRKEF